MDLAFFVTLKHTKTIPRVPELLWRVDLKSFYLAAEQTGNGILLSETDLQTDLSETVWIFLGIWHSSLLSNGQVRATFSSVLANGLT